MRFWLINILVWGSYSGLFLWQGVRYFGWVSGMLLIAVLFGIGTLLASAAIRRQVLGRDLLRLPAGPLALRLAGMVALAALAVQLLIGLVLRAALLAGWVRMPPDPSGYSVASVLGYWLNTAIMLALWTAVWTGWQALQRVRHGEIARLRAESAQRALQLDVLRTRLNPHFVFNALNNLRALILEDPPRARELVTRLSSTLRHALEHSPRDQVSLADELAVVDDYLAVEAVQFEERLQVRREIDPRALGAQLPAMLLQLLVENAIKHGIARTAGGGQLGLRAALEAGALRLEVDSPGRLGGSAAGTGVGLQYLRAQLALLSPPGQFELTERDGRVQARLLVHQPGAVPCAA